MTWKISLMIVLLLFLGSCKNDRNRHTDTESAVVQDYLTSECLLEADVLLSNPKGLDVKFIDFRKREDYQKSHLPGAINIWRNDIEDSMYPYRGMMASKNTIEALFSELGIQNTDTLIVYDNHSGSDAARLWWVLQNYDFGAVKLLNGGITAWISAGGEVTDEISEFPSSKFTLPAHSSMKYLIGLEGLKQELVKKNPPLLLDVRTHDEYTGKRQKSGASRAGRIPNSQWIDWAHAIDYHGSGKFRSTKELEALYGQLGISKEDPIITYCHTGVRSAHTTFVLTELLGYTKVKNYDGSWTEWSYFEDLPIGKDSITLTLQ
ncbi:sulfurtransferase [Flavobacteriaceae bacterium TP-CH-4]|uniref:Sulfurtransferase n=1 Tax=Pelagihabitans pacificus TaxID=2696054 RepID=A0A967ATD8_9FLAO|nr:sulfurtransferase [Pelagihabitans pacificus]NHF59664.1 sulfurtransferase [Pelagihabitans pacificus]